MSGAARHDDAFEAERARLVRLAYRMLGERAAAEDVVQETFLRWAKADRSAIANPQAWLTRAASLSWARRWALRCRLKTSSQSCLANSPSRVCRSRCRR